MEPVRLAFLAALAACVLSNGAVEPGALMAVLASTAALGAARERRHRDMALAAGIAAGASPVGLALLPVLLGTALARRTMPTALAFIPALLATVSLIGWQPGTAGSLLDLLSLRFSAVSISAACGIAAWIGASCAARSPLPRELDSAALLACVSLPLLAPVGVEAAGLAVALAFGGTRFSLCPIACGANDDPLPLRVRTT